MEKEKIAESMRWRCAIKKFDPSKKISKADFDDILESLRLAPSSFGLQPWKFIVIGDKKIREELRKSAWDQAQITDAEYLIVLCARTDLDEDYVEKFIRRVSNIRGTTLESLENYKKMLLNPIKNLSKEQLIEWSKKQVYIALGVLLTVAAEKNIDACPMEGFDSKKFDEILKLSEKGLTATVLCPIGYRSSEDKYSNEKKVRFEQKEVFDFI